MKKYKTSLLNKIIFVIIVFLLISIIFYYFISVISVKKETFENKKGLLLLFGESFREGGEGTRLRDTEASFEPQKIASESHVQFCQHIKNKYDITMDILINTYDTKYENELKSWYQDYDLKYMSNKELIGFKLVQDAVDSIDTNQYDFIFITRMDILIKPYFLDIFNPEWNKIYFAFQETTGWDKCGFWPDSSESLEPILSPIFEFIPKKYFKVLNKVDVEHYAWRNYKNEFGLKDDEMDFMIDTHHATSSDLGYNPMYKMVSRPETKYWYDKDKKIDRSLFGTNTKLECQPLPAEVYSLIEQMYIK